MAFHLWLSLLLFCHWSWPVYMLAFVGVLVLVLKETPISDNKVTIMLHRLYSSAPKTRQIVN